MIVAVITTQYLKHGLSETAFAILAAAGTIHMIKKMPLLLLVIALSAIACFSQPAPATSASPSLQRAVGSGSRKTL